MKFKARLFSTQEPASDSSMISANVAEEFFASEKFKQALADRRLFGTLTHAARNLQACKNYNPALAKTVGKDDQLLLDMPMTHILTKAWLEPDGWAYGEFEVLKKDGMDDEAIQKIKRLEGLLLNGCKIGISCVILGFWDNKDGRDYLKKFVELKGADITCNPSWKNAGIVSIDTEDRGREKTFSEIDKEFVYNPKDYEDNRILVKQFSVKDVDLPKSSKIDGRYTQLKAKSFSFNSDLILTDADSSEIITNEQPEQKEFTQASVRDRLREARMSPRMYFRRVYLSYSQVVKSMGGPSKIKPDDLKILKSMFTSDILWILNQIQPEVVNKSKQINTLLGCSSISKSARQAAQTLQQPLRMAGIEVKKQGFLTKNRYVKLQDSYLEFIRSLQEGVFGPNPEPIKEEPEDMENEK